MVLQPALTRITGVRFPQGLPLTNIKSVVILLEMKTTTRYSVQYHVLLAGGGSINSSFSTPTLKDLRNKMTELVLKEKEYGSQAVLFEQIVKSTETKIEARGSFVQFVSSLSEDVNCGQPQVDQEFYKPLKR